jgi:hypothetical protein
MYEWLWFSLFKPLLAIFQYIVAVSFNGAGEKTTDLPQVKDKLYHIMLYRVHLA